jgi:vacuolar protein 8
MLSPNVEVCSFFTRCYPLLPAIQIQCNSVGCITNLATHDDNKHLIAKSGALGPLIKLARSKDMRVSRNSCGAALNMTHSVENRRHLINAGALPTLVSLLTSSDSDVQCVRTRSLCSRKLTRRPDTTAPPPSATSPSTATIDANSPAPSPSSSRTSSTSWSRPA